MDGKNVMEKRYGKFTAISMVVGIVIGSGVFFKAVKVLSLTGGSMGKSLLVIGIVGLICISCSCAFAAMGTKYFKCNGIIDYAEVAGGPFFAYFLGWFMSTMYYPVIASTLAYISARYTCALFGLEAFGQANASIALLYLFVGFGINALSPSLAGKLQVSMTVIKLIPLVVMGVVGTIAGFVNGNGITIFTESAVSAGGDASGVLPAVCAFAFAYEGWIVATTINQELKNPKKDLPVALIGGSLFCTLIYMLYTYSMSATMDAAGILAAGDDLPKIAFSNMFGSAVGVIVMVIIVISCLGTMNGMILSTMRGFYSMAIRGQGPNPKSVAEIDKSTGMPLKSCILGAIAMAFWLFQTSCLFFNGPLVMNTTGNPEWLLAWEADEILIVVQYLMYIPIFLHMIIKEKDFNFLQRFILPVFGLASSVFMAFCCVKAYGGRQVIYFLVFFTLLMSVGMMFYVPSAAKKKAKK